MFIQTYLPFPNEQADCLLKDEFGKGIGVVDERIVVVKTVDV